MPDSRDARFLLAGLVLAFAACSRTLTVAEIRDQDFRNYRPAAVTRQIDAAIAIETTASAGFSTMESGRVEAMREILAEDLATLFTRPSLRRGGPEDFVLTVAMAHRDAWVSRIVEVTATLVEAKTDRRIASYQRGAEVSAGKGLPGPGELVDIAAGLKRDILRTFEQDAALARHLAPSAVAARPPAGPRPAPGETAVAPAAYGASWALVVGIDTYQHAPPLSYAANDARAVAAVLPRLGFQHVRVLLDEQATKAAIEQVVYDEFQRRMGPNDRLLVFFAGHGVTVTLPRGGEEGYLVPVDGDATRPALTAIAMDEVRKMGRRVPAKHILFAIDACFSGFAVSRNIAPESVGEADLAAALQEPVVQVLTAGRKGQRAIEEEGHGLFTRRFLDALRGLADRDHRGFITGSQLGVWVGTRVTRDSGGRQTPQFSALDGEGDFVFVLPPPPASTPQ
ncbi:MAG: caspase family protein [Candidatus Rokubacteria bacterium]|nr:caspase family protein [Candidatus Rokubacteria bacterium]